MMCWIFKAHNFNESEQIDNKTPFKFVMVAMDQQSSEIICTISRFQ